jgi:succinate dehydrogenase / fumarate reductase cytochrome b subunit
MYRPISPHILIYKPQINSILSVFHRITASILSIFILNIFIIIKLQAIIYNYYPLYTWTCLLHNHYIWFFLAFLIVILLSFFYHISNGIRHLIWDFSKNHHLYLTKNDSTSYFVLLNTIIFFIFFLFMLSFF